MNAPVALVAGGSRGLGLEVARDLLRRGYRVALCARTGADLEAAGDLLAPLGTVRTHVCDVRDQQQVEALVAEVDRSWGPVEVLVSVAGVIQVGPATSSTDEHYRAAVETMLWGPIHLARAVLPAMRHRDSGRIGTVTSIGGRLSPPHLLPYAVAKFGAVGFSEGLSADLAGTGVTATTIVPGLMRTGSHERALFTGRQEAEYAWFAPAASLPLLTMPADRAARKMVAAVLAGKPVVTLTLLAKVGSRVHGVAPASTVRMIGLVNRLLPAGPAADAGSTALTGRQARSRLSGTPRKVVDALTVLGTAAARRTNQRPGQAVRSSAASRSSSVMPPQTP